MFTNAVCSSNNVCVCGYFSVGSRTFDCNRICLKLGCSALEALKMLKLSFEE
jgi:hypothetical protein